MNKLSVKYRTSGIYKITNRINNKVYIGCSQNLYSRCCDYHSDYKNNKTRINRKLLKDIKLYGFDKFTFEIIEKCNISDLKEREYFWILHYKSINDNFGYNLRTDTNKGMVTHPETSVKISKRLQKEWKEGLRDNHSIKLKKSWENRDREEQSKLMSSIKTKWKYKVTNKEGDVFNYCYQDLKDNGLKNVIVSFHRKGTNKVIFKGLTIERFSFGED